MMLEATVNDSHYWEELLLSEHAGALEKSVQPIKIRTKYRETTYFKHIEYFSNHYLIPHLNTNLGYKIFFVFFFILLIFLTFKSPAEWKKIWFPKFESSADDSLRQWKDSFHDLRI